MSLQIIIRGKNTYGKGRAEQEANFRKDGMKSMDDENFDRIRFLEKKTGYKEFIPQAKLKELSDHLE